MSSSFVVYRKLRHKENYNTKIDVDCWLDTSSRSIITLALAPFQPDSLHNADESRVNGAGTEVKWVMRQGRADYTQQNINLIKYKTFKQT